MLSSGITMKRFSEAPHCRAIRSVFARYLERLRTGWVLADDALRVAAQPSDASSSGDSVLQVLREMSFELRVFEACNKIKACQMTAKGMLGVVLQVYSSDTAGSPSMVEVRV